ncbi:MAG TPA: ATP-binding protein [Polyangiales bacterium]|nr:ATP-binding protein [Polyangiales bacterium]
MSENARALERELDWLATVLDEVRLSVIGSRYFGETEKNLARVFEQAERAGSILVFDEADALFGKRTRVNDAHDRFANQEVSFLLQRIEEFAGPMILASNLRVSIDEAFLRRFNSVVAFPVPHRPRRGVGYFVSEQFAWLLTASTSRVAVFARSVLTAFMLREAAASSARCWSH